MSRTDYKDCHWKLDPDQSDTGKVGVRKYCPKHKHQITVFDPLAHYLLKRKAERETSHR